MDTQNNHPVFPLRKYSMLGNRGILFGSLLLVALLAFEAFNFSTTQVALTDLLGNIAFAGISWSTILAVAFCGIDFAGIARLFVSKDDSTASDNGTWFLFGAWLLAATMNALLTWWGVSIALVDRSLRSTAFIKQDTLVQVVPVFVALIVWVTRILLIGTFSIAGSRLFTTRQKDEPAMITHMIDLSTQSRRNIPIPERRAPLPPIDRRRPTPAPKPDHQEPEYVPEPAYSPLHASAHTLAGRTSTNRTTDGKAKF